MRTTETDPVLRLLGAANPVAPERARRLLDEAEAAAILERATSEGTDSPRRPRRGRGPALAAAVAASGLVAWAIVTSADQGVPNFPALDRAAAAAAAVLPAPDPSSGSLRYERWQSADLVTTVVDEDTAFSALVARRVETWADTQGRVIVRARSVPARFLGPADEAAWRAAGSPRLSGGGTSGTERGESVADLEYLASRAGDPEVLLAAVRAQGGLTITDDPSQSIVRIADLLRDPAAPPELRAGLYRALALVADLDVEENARDPLGRQGVAFGVVSSDSGARMRTRLIFDPQTSRLLAEETVLLDDVNWVDVRPPASIGWRAVVDQGFAKEVGQRPNEPRE